MSCFQPQTFSLILATPRHAIYFFVACLRQRLPPPDISAIAEASIRLFILIFIAAHFDSAAFAAMIRPPLPLIRFLMPSADEGAAIFLAIASLPFLRFIASRRRHFRFSMRDAEQAACRFIFFAARFRREPAAFAFTPSVFYCRGSRLRRLAGQPLSAAEFTAADADATPFATLMLSACCRPLRLYAMPPLPALRRRCSHCVFLPMPPADFHIFHYAH